jgi:hypothetical protein
MMSDALKVGLCPDCKAVVSRLAAGCPRCGRPIREGELLDLPQHPQASVAGCSQTFQWGCAIVVLIIIIIMIIGAVSHQPLTDEDRMRQIRKNEQTGREMYR